MNVSIIQQPQAETPYFERQDNTEKMCTTAPGVPRRERECYLMRATSAASVERRLGTPGLIQNWNFSSAPKGLRQQLVWEITHLYFGRSVVTGCE